MTDRFPYHPDFGLTDDYRIEAVKLAEALGSNVLAAERCGVSEASIRNWRNDLLKTEKTE